MNGDYYIIYGRRTSDPAPGVLRTHFGVSPTVSSRQFNPAPPGVVIPQGVSVPVCITTACVLIITISINLLALTLHFSTLHYITLHYITLHYITLHCIILHYITLQTRSATDYSLIFREPEECDPSACNTFIGIDTNQGNSDYMDIYMEGATEGWIAVGFTKTPNMVCPFQGVCRCS